MLDMKKTDLAVRLVCAVTGSCWGASAGASRTSCTRRGPTPAAGGSDGAAGAAAFVAGAAAAARRRAAPRIPAGVT